jgi:hypothetical protein
MPNAAAWQQQQQQQQMAMQQQMAAAASMQQQQAMQMQAMRMQAMQQQQQQQMRPQASAPSPQQQQPHKQPTQQQLPGAKQYDFQGARKRSAPNDAGPGSNNSKSWVSNKAAKRAAASAPLVPMSGPVVVRPAANAEEAAEIEAWKAERRKHWPSAANTSKKVRPA